MRSSTTRTVNVIRTSTGGEPSGSAGVGIYFQQDGSDNDVYVKALVKGASAERDGTVKLGDVITTIDGRNIIGQSLNTLRSLIRGEVGTYVDLGFRRQDPYTGQDQAFEVSLMRGSAEYLAWMERKNLEDQLAALRSQLNEKEAELDRIRRQIRESEQQADALHSEASRLRPQIEAHKENLADVQYRCKGEFDECRRLEDLIAPLGDERERAKREHDRLRKLLRQVEDQLLESKDNLDESQRRYLETEDAWKKQYQVRLDCEARLKKTEEEMRHRREEDRLSKEDQERVRHQMELDVRGMRNRLSQEQHETIREKQKREAAEKHLGDLEEDLTRLDKENQRLQKLVRDAEAALQQSQLAKTQVESMTTELQRASYKLNDQFRVQESHKEDLKRRIQDEQERWEKSVSKIQSVRQEELARFNEREQQLTSEHNRVSDLFQQTRMAMEGENAKLNELLGHIVPETSSLQRGLQSERATTEHLRQEMNAHAQRMEHVGEELLKARDQLNKVEHKTQQIAGEKDRVESRTRGIEEEILRELQKEALRANFVSELERKMDAERIELEEIVRREEDKRREAELDRVRLEDNIKACVEKIRDLVQRDKEYISRLDEFRTAHSDLVSRFHELVRQQQNVRANIVNASSPYDDNRSTPHQRDSILKITLPGFGVADPSQLGGRRQIAGLITAPPPVYSGQYRVGLDPIAGFATRGTR